MNIALRLLMVEDSLADFHLTLRNLQKEGLEVEARRVDRVEDLEAALREGPWDALVSDYSVPGMPFRDTLRRVRNLPVPMPILLFSGSIGEEEAMALLKLGLRDFVLKDRPGRLATAICNAIEEDQAQASNQRTMEALIASEARFMATFAQANIGIAMVALDGRIILANQRLCDILGYTPDEIVSRTSRDLSSAEDADLTWRNIQDLMEGRGTTFTQEKVNLRKDGTRVWVNLSVTLVRKQSGEPDYLVSVVEDISRRKDAEARAQKSQILLRSIMDSIGPTLVVLDERGAIVHVNRSWSEFARANGGNEAVARGIGLNYLETLLPLPGEDPARIARGMDDVLQGRLPRLDLEYACDGPEVDRRFHMAVTPLTGLHRGLVIIHTEITDRLRADKARRASDERFSAVFQASPVAILLTRVEDQTVLDANPGFLALSGWERSQLLGRTTQEIAFWEDPLQRRDALERVQAEGSLRNFEMAFRTASGRPGRAMVSSEIVTAGGEPVMVDLFRDITEVREAREKERQMERELNHLQRLESVGRLAGGISHDMNNVLGAVMAMASVLKEQPGTDPDVARKADVIAQAATRGRDLVKGLTDFSRKEVVDPLPLDLNLLAEREAELMEHTTFRRIEIRLDLHRPLPEIRGEASALSNVLMNLCVNACDAMPAGGTLTLRTRAPRPDRVELEVEDTGEGMPPEVLARALEPFFTTKPAGKGTGLGLSSVYGTLKAHGGTVEIQSAPGRGTRVILGFPSLAEPGPARAEDAPDAEGPGRPRRILVVDDGELIRMTLPSLLEILGHRAEVTSSGLEALRRLEAGLEADVVILDMNMPGLSGLETLSRLRILRPQLPVIVSSGRRDPQAAEQLQHFKGLHYLDKPFDLEDLRRILG
jgi:PAS domain S-box-containing protein